MIFPYFCTILSPTLKKINDSVPMVISFKVFKYFCNGKISFYQYASLSQQDLKPEKLIFPLQRSWERSFPEVMTVGWIEKRVVISPQKCWFVARICIFQKLMEFANDHSPDVYIISTFRIIFYNWNYTWNYNWNWI